MASGFFSLFYKKINSTIKSPIDTLGFIKILGMFENIKPN